ncbi:MAG: glutathione S-transferase N-terminal domain-containing protein [Desulfofustis sp.]|nr:glutathione S-transferase N-terminal domain-containing protein [Desulfofustis sp.]MBT8344743.1 glutathione S-transferase N-terminal domain-containing protein [Desulfofustis sp.]MBT8353310.1 glutathione S-transferase N-terminal domain-containing protein [Desulfofustis sp.]NNK56189.1 glutathione S-transferase [Desulfofustis sp.]
MIKLYTWGTPNGRKISIMLEEVALPYQAVPVDISKGEQFDPDFLAINPNNKIPAIIDEDTGQSIFESGAILLYLAEKSGKLLPDNANDKWRVMQWLMWQMAGQGPMLGQAHHFLQFNPGKSAYAEERYLQEAIRLYGVLDSQLEGQRHVAVDDLTIADIAIWPWVSRYQFQKIDLHAYPNVLDWYLRLAQRPAFQTGYKVPDSSQEILMPDG